MTHGWIHMPVNDWLIGLGQFLVGIVVVFLLGRVLHELTHVLVANLMGFSVERVRLRPLNGRVEYDAHASTRVWKIRVVNAAPQIVGIILGTPLLVYTYLTSNQLLQFIIFVGWASYTLLGASSDISVNDALRGGHRWQPQEHEQLALVALGLLIGAFITGSIDPNTYYFGPFRYAIQLGFAIAGVGVFFMSLQSFSRQNEGRT